MSSPHPQSLRGQILNHDRVVMPSPLTSVIGQSSFVQDTRNEPKFTLLSRSQQPIGTVDPTSIGLIVPPRSSLESIQNSSISGVNPSSTVSFAGRAARDDYFDTEDPSVNLHDFIINSMQSQKNRVILVKLEEEFVNYVQDVSRIDPLKLPPWDSYHRMLAHRVAAYFGLEHNVDPLDKMCVVVHKGPNTRLPQRRFSDCMAKPQEEIETSEPKLILKRTTKEVAEAKKLETILGSSSDVSGLKSLKTFEEREEEYERARARIFSQQSPLETKEPTPSVVFDLETASARRKSRILPTIMQHRRAASDTTAFLFNRGALSELRKEGPSSDHSSRSITPLLSHLNKSTEALSRAVGSHQELDQSPSKQLSPHTPRKISQVQFDQHSVVPHSPPKFSKSLSDIHSTSNHETSETNTVSPTAAQFQSVQGGLPVIYHQPGAVLADPNWYSYQQMMVYQVSPHGYAPSQHYSPFGPAVLQPGQFYAVNQPYPTLPAGNLAPGTMLAPGKDAQVSPQGGATRPGGVHGYEQYPPTPPGIALVKPIPQQASPIRVASRPVGPWGSPIHQPFPIHQPVVVQPQSDQPAYTTVVPYPQDIRASHLADQMDGSLHISDTGVPEGPNSSESVKTFSSKPSDSAVSSQFDRSAPQVGTSTPVDGVYTVTSVGVGGVTQNVVGGSVVSPTLPHAPIPFVPQQVPHPMYGGGPEAGFLNPGSQGSLVRYPAGFTPQVSTPAQPSTPGHLSFPPGVLQGRPQGVFSPSSAGLTHSPVQILGHTLGTSLFSPPPSTSSHPALFGQTSSGKAQGDPPTHPPIGAVPDSPGLVSGCYNGTPTSGSNSPSGQLPPRLSVQGRHKSGANRYQNQRHPANRGSKLQGTGAQELSGTTVADHVSNSPSTGRKEALLPTPPSHHIVKLDTTLTCGVPLNIMELVSFPPDGSPEMLQVMQVLNDMGVGETKTGVIPKTGERVMIAVFDSADNAMKALQFKHPHFVLSIPGNNHAKFILSLL